MAVIKGNIFSAALRKSIKKQDKMENAGCLPLDKKTSESV